MFRLLISLASLAVLAASAAADLVLLCGMDEVFAVDAARLEAGTVEKVWSWKAAGREELPAEVRRAFGTTDDCKPVEGGSRILVTSSGGGCALVEYPSGKVLWHARVPNAHSIELLPGNRAIVAGSLHKNGNRLVLFDLAKSDEPLWETPLHSAHGVVWDADRQRLWALGFDELRCYRLANWDSAAPSLALEKSHPLPDNDGHDLVPMPSGGELVVTTHHHVFLFDRETGEFRKHPMLDGKPETKSVSIHPKTGRLVSIHSNGSNWWNDRIVLTDPAADGASAPVAKTVPLPGEKLYKARWFSTPDAERK